MVNFTDIFMFTVPHIPPSKEDAEASLRPMPFQLDIDFWNKAYHPTEHSGNPLLRHIDQIIQQGETQLSYHYVANPRRSPRRYPLIRPNKQFPRFLLSQNDLKDEELKDPCNLFLSNVPRTFRPVLQPQEGYELWDADINRSHFAVGGSLAQDSAMLQWLQHDIHQDTGELFGRKLADRQSRRRLGKKINSSILMGVSPVGIRKISKKFLQKEEYSKDEIDRLAITEADASTYLQTWWSQFPALQTMRREHQRFVQQLRDSKQEYKLAYGRNLATYDPYNLHGTCFSAKKEQRSESYVLRSCWSALLTSYEAALMDHICLIAWQQGLRIGCLMYDGLMFQAKVGSDLSVFRQRVDELFAKWEIATTMELTRLA